MKTNVRNLILIVVFVVALFAAVTIFYVSQSPCFQSAGKKVGTLSSQQAAEKAINYFNQNLLQKGVTASLVNVAEENGLYKFRFKIGDQEFKSFVTKDGKILFPEEGINLEEKPATTTSKEEPKKLTCGDIKKSDKPLLDAFVVSQCPYGLQMQRILNEIVKNVPSLANNIKVRYIGSVEGNKITSMHGEPEAAENLRQICLREEQPEKYWKYIDCHIKKGEVDSCLISAAVDRDKLNTCSQGSKGLTYAKEDFGLQEKYNVTGSPTLLLSGERVSEFDFGGRIAEAVKTLLCCGFEQKSNFCSQKLSEDSAATGFSESYGGSDGSTGGGCGQ